MSLIPPIRIPVGSTEYVGMTVTGPEGVDLMDDVVQLAAVDTSRNPIDDDWTDPGLLVFPSQHVVQASLLVGPGGVELQPGTYRLWMRIVDIPETPWVSCPDVFRVS